MRYFHLLGELIEAHIRKPITAAEFIGRKIRVEDVPRFSAKNILRREMMDPGKETEFIRKIMNICYQLCFSQRVLYPGTHIQKFLPCPSDDRNIESNLKLPDIHDALTDPLKRSRFYIESTHHSLVFRSIFSSRISLWPWSVRQLSDLVQRQCFSCIQHRYLSVPTWT